MQAIYSEAKSTVMVSGMQSDWFQLSVGSRQGDPLSSRAFILLLERIMDPVNELQNSGVKVQGVRINNLKFADDIDLLEETNSGLQDLLSRLHTESERYWMHLTVDKTKTIVFGSRIEENNSTVFLNGTVL